MFPPRKYRINEHIEALVSTGLKTKGQIIRELCEKLGISDAHLRLIRSYRYGESAAASSDQLMIIAEYFSCTVDDLLNKQASHATETP